MTKGLRVTTEAVDDMPILVATAERMGVADLVDKHFVVDSKWRDGLRTCGHAAAHVR